jgi:thiamine pyrophosphate-dependent acetolactate synthase large subunit-like protein
VERILWVDAICINQHDNDEKGQQVQSMAKIYAKASRVIVWLGEAADNSDQALEAIRMAAEEQHTSSVIYKPNQEAILALSDQHPTNFPSNGTNQQAILGLLERPWFQRIWVSNR